MTLDIRETRPDELRAAHETTAAALMFPPASDDEWPAREPGWAETDSVTAWDGERCVGHAGAFRFDTVVPGGSRVGTAGVTRVGVLPTHTRRGLLSGMMRRLLATALERGDALASLRASEAVIYGRFGFGLAAEAAGTVVDATRAGAVRDSAGGSIRLLHRDEIMAVVPPLYERTRRRVGSVSRPPVFFAALLRPAVERRQAAFVAVHEDEHGEPDGYVHYEIRWGDADHLMKEVGEGRVHDLFGIDDAVERALWAHVLGVDLVRTWRCRERPVDDPLRSAIADRRAVTSIPFDEQWVRVLDVERALAARTYAPVAGEVRIGVRDRWFDANAGTFVVGAGGVRRDDAASPDLDVDVAVLSAAYLGGTSWVELAGAGLVPGARAGAIELADALFATRPSPFCGTFF